MLPGTKNVPPLISTAKAAIVIDVRRSVGGARYMRIT
jgi:hypothetical protein